MFLASKFVEGAWLLMIIVPSLIFLFAHFENYYRTVAEQLGLGRIPARPHRAPDPHSMVIVPVVAVSAVAEQALQLAMRLGDEVVAIAVEIDPSSTRQLSELWKRWDPGKQIAAGHRVAVLLAQVEPRHWRHRFLHNQRGIVLAAALQARTDAAVTTLAIRID